MHRNIAVGAKEHALHQPELGRGVRAKSPSSAGLSHDRARRGAQVRARCRRSRSFLSFAARRAGRSATREHDGREEARVQRLRLGSRPRRRRCSRGATNGRQPSTSALASSRALSGRLSSSGSSSALLLARGSPRRAPARARGLAPRPRRRSRGQRGRGTPRGRCRAARPSRPPSRRRPAIRGAEKALDGARSPKAAPRPRTSQRHVRRRSRAWPRRTEVEAAS